MKTLIFLLLVPSFAAAQEGADLLRQGAEVFGDSCATGYCHGAQGAGGGAPRVSARGFDQMFIDDTVRNGVIDTAMPAFAGTLSQTQLNAVVAYVAALNGIAVSSANTPPEPSAGTALSPQSDQGRLLFSDAVRSFGRCATCHEVNGIGIPVAAPIASIPDDVRSLRDIATPRVSTLRVDGEPLPALVLSNKSDAILFYDLTTAPPVLRTEDPAAVRVDGGSDWRHAAAISSYDDAELASVLAYLRAVTK